MSEYLKFFRSFVVLMIGVLFLVGCGTSEETTADITTPIVTTTPSNGEGNTTNPNNTQKTTVSGYVVDDPIENANVSLFSIDGTLLDENITTNKEGYFEVQVEDFPSEYIVYSSGGEINGTSFDGELFAYCQENSCNLTPLSTITYQYANLLSDSTFSSKYANAKNIITEYLGVSSEEIHKISNVESFKFDKFRELVREEGFPSIISGIVNDLVDNYIDESKYQVLFTANKARIATPISVNVEPIIDEESNSTLSLIVSAIDGSQESKGYMSDIIATTKQTVINDDLEEVEEDVTVYNSFNIGEYKGKLNAETTVLSNLFTNNIELALLPSESKVKLVELLKQEYKSDYDDTITEYKNFVEKSSLYYPLYENMLFKLISNSKNLLSKDSITSEIKASKTSNEKNIFLKSNRANFLKTINYVATSNIKVNYDTDTYKFTVKNTLPVYFGVRDTTKELSTIENLTTPLVNPSSAGAAGILLSQLESDTLNGTLEWISGKKNEESTPLDGDYWDEKLFPTSGSQPISGEYQYDIHKDFGFNSPTIMNITQIAKPIVSIAAGGGLGDKFQEIVKNSSKSLDDFKKSLQWFTDSLDAAESISEVVYLILDESINNYSDKNLVPTELVNSKLFFKNLNGTLKSYNTIASGLSNILPPSPSDNIEKRANKFITSISKKGGGKITLNKAIIPKILEEKSKGNISSKNAYITISAGAFFGNLLSNMKVKTDKVPLGYSNYQEYSTEIKDFEKNFGINIKTFTYIWLFKNLGGSNSRTDVLFNQFSTKKDLFGSAKKSFLKLAVVKMLEGGNTRLILENIRKKINEDIKFAKIIADVKRGSSGKDILEHGGQFIVKILKKSKDSIAQQLQGIAQNIIREVPSYIFGTKAVQIVGAANDIIGVAYGLGMTPDSIPIGISVDDNGELTFQEPEIKVLGAVNELKRIESQRDSILTFQNTRHPLVVASPSSSPVYTLSYNIIFGNEFNQLKDIYNLKTWESDMAISAGMTIKKYPDDNVNNEAEVFGSQNNVFTTITPNEVEDNLVKEEIYPNIGATLDIAKVLAKQSYPWFSMIDEIYVSNTIRGIFLETFAYSVYEFNTSPLKGRSTAIKTPDRMVFKAFSAKDIRDKLSFYHYNKHDGTLAITNNNDFSITIHNNSTGNMVDEEWELLAGQTRLFSYDKYKDSEFEIMDSVVQKYGESHGFVTMENTLEELSKTIITGGGGLSALFNKYSTPVASASTAEAYQFILTAKATDFTDEQPDLDTSKVVGKEDLINLLFDSTTKVLLSSTVSDSDYILNQYQSNSNESDEFGFSLALESGAKISTEIPKDSEAYKLKDNYVAMALDNYKLETEINTYNQVQQMRLINSFGGAIDLSVITYQDKEDGKTLYLNIDSGIEHFIDCATSECIEQLSTLKFRLIITTNNSLHPDSDDDNIVDSVDMFPNNSEYQFDTDRDGMPDAWETEYGLNLHDSSDATKDLNNDGENNLEEFTNGTNPKNTPPTANAGADQTITFGETVTLDASGSTDDNKESLTYTWSWKSDVDDSTLEKEAISFEVAGLSVGEHTFTLTVTDSDGEVDSDEVKIIVNKNIVRTITYQAKNTYRTFDDGRTDLQESISFQKEYDKLLFMGTENGKLIVLDAQTLEEKSKVVIDVDEFAYIDAKVDYIYKYGDDIYVSLNVKPSSLDGYDADMYIAQYKMKDNQIDSFTRLFKLRSDPSNGRSDGGPITGMHIYGDYLYLTAGGSVASYNLSETPIKEVKYSWIYGGVKNLCGIGNKVYVYGNPSANSYAISKYSIDKGEYTYEKSIDTKSLSEYDYRNKTLTCHDDKIFTAYGVLDEDLNVLVNTSNDSYWSIKGEKAYTIDYVYSKSSKTCDLKGMEVNLTNNLTSTIDINIDSDINSYEDCKNSNLLNSSLKYDSNYIGTFSNSNSGEISVYSSTLNILKFYKTNGYINNISKNSNSVYVGTRLKILKMINNSTYKVLTTNSIFNKIGQAFGSFDVNDDYLLATTSYSSNDKNIHLFNLNSDSIELLYNGTAYYGGGRAKLCKDTILVSAMTYSASAAFDVVKIYNYNLEAEALSSRYFGTSYFTCDMNGMYYMNYSNYYAHTSTQLYKIIYSSENKRWEGNNILSRGGSFSPVYSDVNKISYLYRGSAYENEDKTSFVLNTIDDTNSTLTYGQDFPFKQESNEFIFYSEDGNEVKRVQSSCSPEYSINTVLKHNKNLWLKSAKGVCNFSFGED